MYLINKSYRNVSYHHHNILFLVISYIYIQYLEISSFLFTRIWRKRSRDGKFETKELFKIDGTAWKVKLTSILFLKYRMEFCGKWNMIEFLIFIFNVFQIFKSNSLVYFNHPLSNFSCSSYTKRELLLFSLLLITCVCVYHFQLHHKVSQLKLIFLNILKTLFLLSYNSLCSKILDWWWFLKCFHVIIVINY